MSIYAGTGISEDRRIESAVFEAIEEAKKKLKGAEVDLVLFFATERFAHPNLSKIISFRIGRGTPIIGAIAPVVFTQERLSKSAIAFALISLNNVYINCAGLKNHSSPKDPLSLGEELGQNLLYGFKNIPRSFALTFTDSSLINPLFFKGLGERLGFIFPIFGGSTKLRYLNQGASNNSSVGILWGGKLNYFLSIKHGFNPIGKPHEISAFSDNVIKKIDGKSASSLYEEYFAKSLLELKKDLRYLSYLYPLGIDLPEEEGYFLRNIIDITKEGWLVCGGQIPPYSKVHLMVSTKESALLATKKATEEQVNFHPNFILAFNSVSRYNLLTREANKEIRLLKSQLPGTSIIGLYTKAELAPLKTSGFAGRLTSYNQTISLLGLK